MQRGGCWFPWNQAETVAWGVCAQSSRTPSATVTTRSLGCGTSAAIGSSHTRYQGNSQSSITISAATAHP